MLNELSDVIDSVDADAVFEDYERAIIEDNVTKKKSASNRRYTATYLTGLYSFEHTDLLFHVMRFFWDKNPAARPMLAFIPVFMRDYLIRSSWEYIRDIESGSTADKWAVVDLLKDQYGDKYSEKVRQSISRNIMSTWTKSGYLKGRYEKERIKPVITPEVVAFALFVSYLFGNHGELLFGHEIIRLLDAPKSELLDLARAAAFKGYITMNHIGDVIDIKFPSYLYPPIKEGSHE